MITIELLRHVFPDCPAERLGHFVEPLQAACAFAELNTRPRVTAFLAQAGVESNQLRHLEENLYYTSAERIVRVFLRRFDGDGDRRIDPEEITAAERFVRRPEALANFVYANRFGNGDEASGDGWRYRGRGIFQLTFKDQYRSCSIAIAGDADTLLLNPEFLTDPDYACLSAAWYWREKNLNRWADLGDFEGLTARINTAKLHLDERVAFWKRGIEALA